MSTVWQAYDVVVTREGAIRAFPRSKGKTKTCAYKEKQLISAAHTVAGSSVINADVCTTSVENESMIFALVVIRAAVRSAKRCDNLAVARRRNALVRARTRGGTNAVKRARNSDARVNSWKNKLRHSVSPA